MTVIIFFQKHNLKKYLLPFVSSQNLLKTWEAYLCTLKKNTKMVEQTYKFEATSFSRCMSPLNFFFQEMFKFSKPRSFINLKQEVEKTHKSAKAEETKKLSWLP